MPPCGVAAGTGLSIGTSSLDWPEPSAISLCKYPTGGCGGCETPHLKQQLRASWRAPLSHNHALPLRYGHSKPVQSAQQPLIHAVEGVGGRIGRVLTY